LCADIQSEHIVTGQNSYKKDTYEVRLQ